MTALDWLALPLAALPRCRAQSVPRTVGVAVMPRVVRKAPVRRHEAAGCEIECTAWSLVSEPADAE